MAVWDTTSLPPREQFGYWHEVICQAFVPLTPRRLGELDEFPATVETRPLAGLNRARLRASAQRTDHGPREVARTDGDFYFVNLQLAGRCLTTVAGATSLVEPGQFVVVDTTEPYFFRFDRPWQMLSYRVPHSALPSGSRGRRPGVGRAVDASGAGAAVTALMRALWPLEATIPGGGDLANSLVDALSAVLTHPTDDPRLPAADHLRGAVTREAILAYAQAHLGDRALDVKGVCGRFAISPRTLHNLFAAGEDSFAAAVRRLRLERSATALAAGEDHATVTDIAAAHGFDDPTSFARAFRRHFGQSPREFRASHAAGVTTEAADQGCSSCTNGTARCTPCRDREHGARNASAQVSQASRGPR